MTHPANVKIDPVFKANAFKDLTAFFKWVDTLFTVNDKRVALQKAGLWYGDTTIRSIAVNPDAYANARKDLTAFFKWIDSQSSGNRVVSLMQAGLWYGDAGPGVAQVLPYVAAAAAIVTTAFVAGPAIATALGGGGTALKDTAKKEAVKVTSAATVSTASTVSSVVASKGISEKVPDLILQAANAAQTIKSTVSSLKTTPILVQSSNSLPGDAYLPGQSVQAKNASNAVTVDSMGNLQSSNQGFGLILMIAAAGFIFFTYMRNK
jgi:hypothetical protein